MEKIQNSVDFTINNKVYIWIRKDGTNSKRTLVALMSYICSYKTKKKMTKSEMKLNHSEIGERKFKAAIGRETKLLPKMLGFGSANGKQQTLDERNMVGTTYHPIRF